MKFASRILSLVVLITAFLFSSISVDAKCLCNCKCNKKTSIFKIAKCSCKCKCNAKSASEVKKCPCNCGCSKKENMKVKESLIQKTFERPWGTYTVIAEGNGYLIKTIAVNPDQKLSVQRHNHRSEHWFVLEGTAKVIKGDKEIILKEGESLDIAVKEIHSLQNPYDKKLTIMEVQKGDIIDENDIERLSDIYGRK